MKKLLVVVLLLASLLTLMGCNQNAQKHEFTGLDDFTYTIGDIKPEWRLGVEVTDVEDGDITRSITVDDSAVVWDTPGTYPVIFTSRDRDGNKTSVTVNITINLSSEEEFNVYYINDTHGAIEENGNQLGLSAIGNLVMSEKEENPDSTLFIGGGDILQGNILSNYYQGASMIHALNTIGLDAFVLGNHEFDWGLDVVTSYFDPDSSDLKATYPLLAANLFRKDTMERPDHVDPYTIIEKGDLKIGVIGLIGYGLENSIATARVSDYMFDEPHVWAAYYAENLRVNEGVDLVLAVVHDNSSYTNQQIAQLTGNQKVDAIFNGHSHSRYTQTISRDGIDVPVIQSKANGEYLGKVTFTINQGEITSATSTNLHPTQSSTSPSDHITRDSRLAGSNASVNEVINEYKLAIQDLLSEVIIYSGNTYGRNDLSYFMAKLIRMSVDADLGIHNFGGTRSDLDANEAITVATLYEIFPFDNKVKYVYLLGSDIKDYANSGDAISYKDGLSLELLKDDVYYKVATNDYVFDKVDNPFIYGVDPIDTGLLIRDLLETVLREQAKTYSSFKTDQPIILTPVSFSITKEEDFV